MFATRAVMLSPYNYSWYEPEWAARLWYGEDWWGDDVNLWHGKSMRYYYSFDPVWSRASVHASHYLLRERRRRIYLMRQCIAFVTGSHPRLGALSLISSLDPNLLQMIVPHPFTE